MAKAAEIPEKTGIVHEDAATARTGHNGFDPEKLRGYVDAYEEEQSLIDEIMREARERCQPHKDNQKEIKSNAADEAQVPKKVFSAVLAKRRLQFKAENVDAALNEPQKETFEQVQHALGMLAETPLGAAVLNKKEAAADKLAEKAYDAGYAAGGTAGEKGINIPKNPHPEGSEQHKDWEEGFTARQSEIAAEMAPEAAAAAE